MLVLAACVPIQPGETALDDAGDDPAIRALAAELTLPPDAREDYIAINRTECDKLRGSYSRQGLAGSYMCILRYSDAGQACTQAGQCKGSCVVRSYATSGRAEGICKANTSPFGCYGTIDAQGAVTPILCRD